MARTVIPRPIPATKLEDSRLAAVAEHEGKANQLLMRSQEQAGAGVTSYFATVNASAKAEPSS